MRSATRITTAFAISLGLIAVPQLAAVQAGASFQDQGIREAVGDSVFSEVSASAHLSYAQETSKPERATTNKRPRAATNKRQHEATATQAHAAAQPNVSGLPGHSARPEGMCWVREVGAGTDMTGGYWATCPKH